MIHRLIVLDRDKSIGKTLYDDGTIDLNQDLLIGLIQALMLLGESMGESKGLLREAELGKLQLAILSKDNLAYCVIQDAIDNEAFTRKLLDGVLDEFHDSFMEQDITRQYKDELAVKARVKDLLTSMVFPKDLLDEVGEMVESFMNNTDHMVDTLFLADLDDGVITVFDGNNENIIKLLLEILSEISFDRQWIGESKLYNSITFKGQERTHEVWVLHRIGITDFVIVGRAYYTPGYQRELLVSEVERLSENIQNLLLNRGMT
ncbi:MAG: hypothetical protein INQ03_18955 [Candidatus Heimdallarchaeota archaeon]|nr:hypothetical protein [Candidatus Heimdallarchaeota archaeon]